MIQKTKTQNTMPIQNTSKSIATTGKPNVTKVTLPLVTLKQKVKLLIPQKVVDQVKFLCQNIWEVEWSGVLFYSTQGEFGSPEFKCIAEHILLMNKGTQAYTEFKSDESVAEFMMDNLEYFEMNQGLVHSHNSMSVFFSGTDNDEIHDNSANHNYYLSLIINNKGEMCAKIAFRGTTVETINKVISFRGTNGEIKTAIIDKEETKEIVYIYDCEIEKKDTIPVGAEFQQRLKTVLEKQKLAEAAKLVKKTKNSFIDMNYEDCTEKYFGTKQYDFSDVDKKTWDNVGKVPSDTAINNFLKKVISVDLLSIESVPSTLEKLKTKFGENYYNADEIQVLSYLQYMMDNLELFYSKEFGDTTGLIETVEIMSDKLVPWVNTNWVAEEIQSMFQDFIYELTKKNI